MLLFSVPHHPFAQSLGRRGHSICRDRRGRLRRRGRRRWVVINCPCRAVTNESSSAFFSDSICSLGVVRNEFWSGMLSRKQVLVSLRIMAGTFLGRASCHGDFPLPAKRMERRRRSRIIGGTRSALSWPESCSAPPATGNDSSTQSPDSRVLSAFGWGEYICFRLVAYVEDRGVA